MSASTAATWRRSPARAVRRHDRGDDVGHGEGEFRPRPRGARHVRPLRNQHGVDITEPRHAAGRATASFASVTGREEDLVAQQARLADLTIVPHPEAGEDVSSSDALHAVLFNSGRPVLIAPQVAPTRIGTRVLLRLERHRRIRVRRAGALPWMQRAEAVRVISADEYQRRGPGAADLADYLAMHGITVELAAPPSARSTATSAPAC